jgi:ABC-type uncharacterized transport system permease subunit
VFALVLDMGGMLAGMIAAHFWIGRAWALRLPPPGLGMHLAMLVGMLAGMLPAMWVRDAVLAHLQRAEIRAAERERITA